MTESYKSGAVYQRPLVIDISLLTRENDETYFEWVARYVKMHRRDPQTREFAVAPFPKVITPVCTTKEKFQWCCENFGVFNFYEYMNDGKKVWMFNHETDAAMFKLRWSGVDESPLDDVGNAIRFI